ncbi:ankyrin repeat-containing domain protein [Plectosphaerella plurivora]|uniref:Ankyrin repeat-containing domain protein n=1 Tax=Plectosphaerella plurivora TaxID=936078 RepID=A0A9P8VCV6_9PEZI|nr:ankyrin repeat-containing domain protein [Plectosphaerella plurivora]
MADASDSEHAYEIVERDMVPAPDAQPDDTPQDSIARLLLWLQPTDYLSPGNEFMKHLASYSPGTGTWIQASSIFRFWADNHGPDFTSCLYARGVAGSGKSVFAANTIRQLQDAGAAVLFFFFRQIVDKNHTAKYLVRDFAAQLLPHCPALVTSLATFSEGHPINGFEVDVVWPAIIEALKELGTSGGRVCCVVDALDEMDDADFDSTVERLVALSTIKPESIRVLMTSRPILKIEQALKTPSVAQLRLDPALLHPDVARYVDARMAALEPPLSTQTRDLVKMTICERANGLFLHARLVADNLAEGLRDARITEASLPDSLDRLPRSLREVYEGMLKDHSRRSGVTSEQQAKILMCVIHASRPLRLIELASLLCRMLDLDLRQGKDLVRAGCGRLLEILEDETVSVIHHSFTEFLHDATRKTDADAFPVLDASSSHAVLAALSLEYLDGCPPFPPDSEEAKTARLTVANGFNRFAEAIRRKNRRRKVRIAHPLAKYAAENLNYHLEKAEEAGPDALNHLLVSLDTFFVPGKPALENWDLFDRNGKLLPIFVLEHFAKTIPALVDVRDWDGRTPLSHAAENGLGKLSILLLERGADPLSVILRLLLDAGVGPLIKTGSIVEEFRYPKYVRHAAKDVEAQRLATPQAVSQRAKPEVVAAFRPFITPEIITWCFHQVTDAVDMRSIIAMGKPDVNSFWRGSTKLYRAAESRNLEIIKVLLEHGADPNRRSCRQPIKSRCTDESISAEVDKKNRERGPTPLHTLAGYSRHTKPRAIEAEEREETMQCVQVLVDAGADVNATMDPIEKAGDDTNLAPLHFAVQKRSFGNSWGNARLLTQLFDLSPDVSITDYKGDTIMHHVMHSLRYFRGRKHMAFVQKLIDAGADLNQVNVEGIAPILRYKQCGSCGHGDYSEVLRLLVEAGMNLNACDTTGASVLWTIVESHRCHCASATLKKLIQLGADPAILKSDGTSSWHPSWYRFLVSVGTRPEISGFNGDTLLHTLLRLPKEERFRDKIPVLLELGVPPLARNAKGQSVLHVASASCLEAVLTNPAFRGLDVNEGDVDGFTPLHMATLSSGKSVGRLLISGAELTALTNAGLSPLHLAARAGDADVYRKRGVLEQLVNCLGEGRAPLHYACQEATHESVRQLLRSGADPSLRDDKGLLPLHVLAEADLTRTRTDAWFSHRTADIVRMLQLAGADLHAEVVVDTATGATMSALDIAVKREQWEMGSKDFVLATNKERASAEARARGQDYKETRDDGQSYAWRGRWAANIAAAPETPTRFILSGQSILDASTKDNDGQVDRIDALTGALRDGDYDSIEEYVRLGGRLDVSLGRHGGTFLHLLVEWDYTDLLEQFADQVFALETSPWVEEEYYEDYEDSEESKKSEDEEDVSYGSLLSTACGRHSPSLHIIQLLVDKVGVDAEIVYSRRGCSYTRIGSAALHVLAKGGHLWHLEALEYLLSSGANTEARDSEGKTPLQVAVSQKYTEGFFWCEDAARLLLEHGADPNAVVLIEDEDGTTTQGPSTLEMWGRPEATRLLVENGALLENVPALVMRAVQKMLPATVELLLEAGLDPNELHPDATGDGSCPQYALQVAARPSNPSWTVAEHLLRQKAIVGLLLTHGADLWARYPDGTSVFQGISEDRSSLGEFLPLIKTEDVERKGRHGRTLLLSACVPPISADAIHTFLELGADVLATDEEEGRTPLHWACTMLNKFDEQNQEAFMILAERSTAALKMADRMGRKPLHLALAAFTNCSQKSSFAVRHLLSLGADVSESDPVGGDSTLHMLARRMIGEKTVAAEAASMFRAVAATQDINARNSAGETPVFSFAAAGWDATWDPEMKTRHPAYAIRNDVMHAAALEVFIELGADLMVVDARGRTLLHATAAREVRGSWSQREDIQDMFERLMELGLDPRAEDEALRTPIDEAVARERNEVLALFTEEGRRKAEEERARRGEPEVEVVAKAACNEDSDSDDSGWDSDWGLFD